MQRGPVGTISTAGRQLDRQTVVVSNTERLPRWEWFLCLILIAVTAAVFLPVLQASFVEWDDGRNIVNNPHLGLGWEQLRWMFTDCDYVRRYLPLGWLSYSVDRVVFGGGPLSYHAGNLLLHLLNTLLVFALLQRLLLLTAGSLAVQRKPAVLVGAALGALCWAVNPLRVEPVAWASARIYCVASTFMLLALWCYLRAYADSAAPDRRFARLAILFFGLSLFTYPIAATGLAIFVVLDVYPLRRLSGEPTRWFSRETRAVWGEKLLFLVPGALMLAMTLWARVDNHGMEPVVTLSQFSLGARIMQSFHVWAYYVWKPWLPFGLGPKYSSLIDFDPWSAPFLMSALLIVALTALLWWRRRTWPTLLAVWVCHLALLVPLLGLTEHPHHTFDRYSYLQGIGWAVVLAGVVWKTWNTVALRACVVPALAAWALFCAVLGREQVRAWNNSISLQTCIAHSLGTHPSRAKHDFRIGFIHAQRGELDKAVEAYRTAIRFDPGYADAYANLGDVLADLRQPAEAIASYREALRLEPGHVAARMNLAITLASTGQLEEAVQHLERAVQQDPRNFSAHHNLALTLTRLGKHDLAQVHSAKARELRQEQASRPAGR